MSHAVEVEEPVYKNEISALNDEFTSPTIREVAIEALASSPSCGLLMLIDKIITSGIKNNTTAHLVQSLISRVHRQTIAIAAGPDDKPESFITCTVDTAMKTASQNFGRMSPLYRAARLFLDSLKLYGMDKLNSNKLEHHWKDFAAILLLDRLNKTQVQLHISTL
jgi:hypothetical protein